jgi:hypothetical protein
MSEERKPKFAPDMAVHMMMVALMACAVAWSIATVLNWWVAVPVALSLSYVFSTQAKTVVSPAGTVAFASRLIAVIVCVFVMMLTLGLSYGSIYRALFAENSAIARFNQARLPVQRQLETTIANAESASKAIDGWDAHSSQQSDEEVQKGGTCPTKSASSRKSGPISIWRASEAKIATGLNKELSTKIASLRKGLDAVKDARPETYPEVVTQIAQINALIEASETLAHGAFIKSAQQTVQRQIDSEIEWPKERFKCGCCRRPKTDHLNG